MTLRVYTDFNSIGPDDDFWVLRYGPALRPLDEYEGELGLYEGMKVLLFQDDGDERFEVYAVLKRGNTAAIRWIAFANMSTFQRVGIGTGPVGADADST
jgi:hypothetical protein